MDDPDDRCVPLCNADNAYGKRVEWWRHDQLCPARRARKPPPENVERP